MPQKLQDYWKDTRLNYDNVVLSNLTMQSNYMADVARGNCDKIEEFDNAFDGTCNWHYWAAFCDILTTFNEGCVSGYSLPIHIERERMKGMLDAMNTLIEMIKNGGFIE